jgi:DNA repair exonuclease SbcCD nuclease subunit
MRILLCGDQHITSRKPKNRTDDYFKTVLGKFKQEIDIAIEEDCQCILFPGDLFDSFKENHLVVQEIMYRMQEFTIKYNGFIFAVPGQHDQYYHNDDLSGTPLQTLYAAKVLTIVGKEPVNITNGVAIYGAGWNEEIPEIITPDHLNILITHRMIINDEKLWKEQQEFEWSNHLLLKTKFDLICSGDNHQQFTVSKNKRHLVNLGSMMRSTIAQLNHKPAVVVYDTSTKEIDIIDLEVRPFQDVMMIEKAAKEKERNEKLEAFIHSLKGRSECDEGQLPGEYTTKLNFVEAINAYVEKYEIPESVHTIIKECLED